MKTFVKNILVWSTCLIVLSPFSYAQKDLLDLDEKLQNYIQNFNLKTIPQPSPRNPELFALGRSLFFEQDLSGNQNISCASCHHPRVMTHDGLPLAIGEGATGIETRPGNRQQNNGQIIARNSPALFNLHRVNTFFWDGRVAFNAQTRTFSTPSPLPYSYKNVLDSGLAAQALFPLLSHEEMLGRPGSNEIAKATNPEKVWNLLFKRIFSKKNYQDLLKKAFPRSYESGKLSMAHLALALAHFQEQAFYSSNSKFDQYLKGDLKALSIKEKKGMDLFFGKGKCGNCHKGELLSSLGFQNIGVPQIGPGKVDGDDLGRFSVTGNRNSIYAFRVPPLRNIALTGPYMHNGVFKTLDEVVEHYDHPELSLRNFTFRNTYKNYVEKIQGHSHQSDQNRLLFLSRRLPLVLNFTEREEELLIVFLKQALTDKRFLHLVN